MRGSNDVRIDVEDVIVTEARIPSVAAVHPQFLAFLDKLSIISLNQRTVADCCFLRGRLDIRHVIATCRLKLIHVLNDRLAEN